MDKEPHEWRHGAGNTGWYNLKTLCNFGLISQIYGKIKLKKGKALNLSLEAWIHLIEQQESIKSFIFFCPFAFLFSVDDLAF